MTVIQWIFYSALNPIKCVVKTHYINAWPYESFRFKESSLHTICYQKYWNFHYPTPLIYDIKLHITFSLIALSLCLSILPPLFMSLSYTLSLSYMFWNAMIQHINNVYMRIHFDPHNIYGATCWHIIMQLNFCFSLVENLDDDKTTDKKEKKRSKCIFDPWAHTLTHSHAYDAWRGKFDWFPLKINERNSITFAISFNFCSRLYVYVKFVHSPFI